MALNLEDAARLLGVSPGTLRRWARTGQLGVRRPSGEFRFDEGQLSSWARANGLRLSQRPQSRASWPGSASATATADEEQALTLALSRGGCCEGLTGDRDAVLAALAAAAPLAAGADPAGLFEQLRAREQLTSTGLGDGVALPHPRTPSAAFSTEPLVVLGRLAEPVDWSALDGRPVDVVLLLVNPTPQAHLKVLSRLAFLLRAPDYPRLLRAGTDFAELLAATAAREPVN